MTVAYSIRISGLLVNKMLSGERVNGASDRDTSILIGMGTLIPFSVAGGFRLRAQLAARPIVIIMPT